MRFRHVRLDAPAGSLPALADFYGTTLGLDVVRRESQVEVAIGETLLELAAAAGAPFYHFALLAPGDRFDAALAWARERVELLPDRERGEVVFDFDFWDARACYCHDPAGNIVELIAHRGIGESGRAGAFGAGELRGVSELGLVGDTETMAETLQAELGLELWDGTTQVEGRLAFVGEPARTLILCPLGRPWLPTGRPAEAHPVEATIAGRTGAAAVGPHRLVGEPG